MSTFPRLPALAALMIALGPPAAPGNGSLDIAPNSPVLLGMGIDLVTGELKQPCIEWAKVQEVATGQDTRFRYELVEDSRSMKKALGVKAQAAYKVPGAYVSAKASFAKEVAANSYSLYILAMVDVRAPTQSLMGVRLSDAAKAVLKRGDGLTRFRRSCGDEYVGALNRAGSFMGVIEVQTSNTKSKQKLKTEISGKMGSFSGSASLSHAVKTASQRNQVKTYQYVTGQSQTALAVEPTQMVANAEAFPKKVSAESALPYRVQTFSYDTLLDWEGPSQVAVDHQTLVVRELGKRREEYLEKIADIDYIRAHEKQFKGVDQTRLVAMRQAIYRNLDRLAHAAGKCHGDLDACRFPKVLEDEDLYRGKRHPLPPRRDDLCYATKKDVACGVARYNSRRDILCGVEAYQSKRDKSCGVERYKLKASAHCGVATYKTSAHPTCGYRWQQFNCEPCFECPRGSVKVKAQFMKLTCKKKVPKRCANPHAGVRTWKTCRAAAHGPELFKSCAQERFGVQAYRACERPEFGVAEYKTCSKPEFGLVDCDKVAGTPPGGGDAAAKRRLELERRRKAEMIKRGVARDRDPVMFLGQ